MATNAELEAKLSTARKSLATANRKRKELMEKYEGTGVQKVSAALIGGALVPVLDTGIQLISGDTSPEMRTIIIAGLATATVFMEGDEDGSAWNDYAAIGALGKIGGDLAEDALGSLGIASTASAPAMSDLFRPAALAPRAAAAQDVVRLAARPQALVARRQAGSALVQRIASAPAFQGLENF